MPAVSFYNVTDAGFRGEAFWDGEQIGLRLSGTADAMAASHLQLMLARLQLEARRHTTRQVTVDFRELEFMVSSCFKSFVTWINKARELEPQSRYRIRFLSDSRFLWQRRSLRALQAFSQEMVSIEFDIKFVE